MKIVTLCREGSCCPIVKVTDEHVEEKIEESQIAQGKTTKEFKELINLQIDRIERLLIKGAPLGSTLSARFGLEIRMIIAGANKIVEKLRNQDDCFSRPRLARWEKIGLLWRAIFKL